MTVTYARLKNGSWGLRVVGTVPVPGAEVVATTKAGDTKRETVERIVWTGDGVSLCTIRKSQYGGTGYRRMGGEGNRAPYGRRCDYCGSNQCSRAWDPRALCDED